MSAAALPSVEEVQALITQAPFHQWLGLTVESIDTEELVLTALGRDEWFNSSDKGVVHGGIISALLDLTADWALLTKGILPSPTIDQTVNYLRPATTLELKVVGRVIKPGRTVSIAEASVMSNGRLVAVSRASYATAGQERTA